jgi:hypothetical protein
MPDRETLREQDGGQQHAIPDPGKIHRMPGQSSPARAPPHGVVKLVASPTPASSVQAAATAPRELNSQIQQAAYWDRRKLPHGRRTLARVQAARRAAEAGDQQPAQICGSTIGVTPDAIDNIAKAIRMIEAHTPKAMSEEFSRSCFATGGYKTVGENRINSVSTSIQSNRGCVAGKGLRSSNERKGAGTTRVTGHASPCVHRIKLVSGWSPDG